MTEPRIFDDTFFQPKEAVQTVENAPGHVSDSEESGMITSSKEKATVGRSRRRANILIADRGQGDDDDADDGDQSPTPPAGNSHATNPVQTSGEQAPAARNQRRRATIELWHTILRSEHPRLRTTLWENGYLHKFDDNTVESCFEEISKLISRPNIQSIQCKLASRMGGRLVPEHSCLVRRDQQDHFDKMRKDFRQRIAVAKKQGDTRFELFVTPDGEDKEVIDEEIGETDDEQEYI